MLFNNPYLQIGTLVIGLFVGVTTLVFNQQDQIKMKTQGEFKGLRTTIYCVPDLKQAQEWYSDVFETEAYFVSEQYIGFSIAGYELGLLHHKDNREKTDNVLSYWGVDDIKSTFQKLLDKGGVVHEKPTDVGDGIMVATVRDPWQNVVGIIYNPHFKAE
ncbi:MAG: VOC family protein [Cyclobacteriaceae bacterium]